MEEVAKDSSVMKNVVVRLREMSADEVERRLAEAREKERLDRIGARLYGVDEGLVKGREEGLQQGLRQGAENRTYEIARNMKADGDPVEKIARNTGLSEEAILAL